MLCHDVSAVRDLSDSAAHCGKMRSNAVRAYELPTSSSRSGTESVLDHSATLRMPRALNPGVHLCGHVGGRSMGGLRDRALPLGGPK